MQAPYNYIQLLIVLLVGSQFELFAQQSAPAAVREYRLQALYRAGVAQNYEFVENTTVERTFSEGTQKTFERKVTYYMTLRCVESSDGIATIVVNADSLIYAFSGEGKSVDYNSQIDISPKDFPDLSNYIGPLNRSYEIVVTPYGEVTKVQGDQIEFWRDYLEQNAADLDSVPYLIWTQSLAKENLIHIGDLQKRVIPGLRMRVDSSWKHNYMLRADGVYYDGKVTSRFAAFNGGLYEIITKDSIPARRMQNIYTVGIPYVTTVLEGHALVDSKLILSASGTIDELSTTVRSDILVAVHAEKIKQRATTTLNWKLTGQYQW